MDRFVTKVPREDEGEMVDEDGGEMVCIDGGVNLVKILHCVQNDIK